MDLFFALILLLLSIGAVIVRKTYFYLPDQELRRRAQKRDALAIRLYSAVAYGGSLRGLLWLFIGATSAGGFILLARSAPVLLSLLAVIGLLWLAFSWIPSTRMTWFGSRLTVFVTPGIVWALNYLHPILDRSVGLAERHYEALDHTGMFERADLLDLVEQQRRQPDSRFSEEELNIVSHALQFGDIKVSSVLVPRKAIKIVQADDTVGPILIDEIHQHGQAFALVRETPKGPIVGSVASEKLGIKSQGKVRDLMEPAVYFLHEKDSLRIALHAFFVTNRPMFVVVNSAESFVGIVTIEAVLAQLLGHMPGEDFDQYADARAVASRYKQAKPRQADAEIAVQTDEKVVE